MTNKKLTSLLFLGISTLFYNCSEVKTKEINKFADKWYAMNGTLIINNDSTFEYARYTSISKSVSNGNWTVVNDTLILNSLPSNECYTEEDFIITPPDSTRIVKQPIKDCALGNGYVKFKDEKFYLKDSLLMSKSSAYMNDGSIDLLYNFKKTTYHPKF